MGNLSKLSMSLKSSQNAGDKEASRCISKSKAPDAVIILSLITHVKAEDQTVCRSGPHRCVLPGKTSGITREAIVYDRILNQV